MNTSNYLNYVNIRRLFTSEIIYVFTHFKLIKDNWFVGCAETVT